MSSNRALRGVPSACHSTGSLMGQRRLALRRPVARNRGGVGAGAEEVVFHLALEVLAGALVGQVQAVLVDQHRLVLEPAGPGLLAHALPDALAQFARVGREVEALGFMAELDAVDGTSHGSPWVCFGVLELAKAFAATLSRFPSPSRHPR
ncbi:MAG: hypothetical protein V9E87_01895 [Gemmatimonadales bacterium]